MVGHASRGPFNAVVHEFPDFRKTELDVLEEFLQPGQDRMALRMPCHFLLVALTLTGSLLKK